MRLLSTMGWNHIAIKEKGLRDIWFRDNSDIYILYLDNSQEPETCRIVKMYDEYAGLTSGTHTVSKEDAEAFLKKLKDGEGFYDHSVNSMPEHKDTPFHLQDVMERIWNAMKHYKEPRGN